MVVLVDTDAGITGIGQGGSPDTVRNVARSVIGKNAFDTEMIWQAASWTGSTRRVRSGCTRSALSTWRCGTSRARRSTRRSTSCSAARRASTSSCTRRWACRRASCRRPKRRRWGLRSARRRRWRPAIVCIAWTAASFRAPAGLQDLQLPRRQPAGQELAVRRLQSRRRARRPWRTIFDSRARIRADHPGRSSRSAKASARTGTG